MNAFTKDRPKTKATPQTKYTLSALAGYCPECLSELPFLDRVIIPNLTVFAILLAWATHSFTQMLMFSHLFESTLYALGLSIGVASAIAVTEVSIGIYQRTADAADWARTPSDSETPIFASKPGINWNAVARRTFPFLIPALVSGLLSMNATLMIFEKDIVENTRERQVINEAPLLRSATATVDEIEADRQRENSSQLQVWEDDRKIANESIEQRIALTKSIANVRKSLTTSNEAASKSRKMFGCEDSGMNSFGCAEKTKPGQGEKYWFHFNEAARHEADAKGYQAMLKELQTDFDNMATNVAPIPRPVFLPQSAEARQESINSLLEADARRYVLDPSSLSTSLTAMSDIADETAMHTSYVWATKAMIFVLESLGILALLFLRSSEYTAALGLRMQRRQSAKNAQRRDLADEEFELISRRARNNGARRVADRNESQ